MAIWNAKSRHQGTVAAVMDSLVASTSQSFIKTLFVSGNFYIVEQQNHLPPHILDQNTGRSIG